VLQIQNSHQNQALRHRVGNILADYCRLSFPVFVLLILSNGVAHAAWYDVFGNRPKAVQESKEAKESKDKKLPTAKASKPNAPQTTLAAPKSSGSSSNSISSVSASTSASDLSGLDSPTVNPAEKEISIPLVAPNASLEHASSTGLVERTGQVQVGPAEWFKPARAQTTGDTPVAPAVPVIPVTPVEPMTPSPNTAAAVNAPVSIAPPNMVDQRKVVGFNDWNQKRLADIIPDPTVADEGSWMKMEVSPDLPPKVAVLSEGLIGAVVKQLPAERRKRVAMPFDEFKLRVRDAVLSYPEVGVADSQLGFAQSGTSLAFASLLPQVQGFSNTGKQTVGQDSYLGTPAYSRDGTSYGVTVRQVLFDFGSTIFGFRAGKAQQAAAQELFNSKKSEQALKTVGAFIDLERARALMTLALENANSRLSIVKLVKERYELGGGAKPDIIRAESRYAEALANVTATQNRLKIAEAGYRDAFNKNPVAIINGPNYEVPIVDQNKTAQELAASYPGLLQLARLKDAANETSSAAIAQMLPGFNLFYNNTTNGVSAPLAPSQTTTLQVQLVYNFYTGGSDTAKKDQAKFKAIQAEREFQSGLRQFEKVLSQNQAEVKNSDDLVAARKIAAVSAISSMRAVREQFAFNKGTLLDLLTAQESLYGAGRDLVDAEADRQLSRYRLLHLTSGLDKLFDLADGVYVDQPPSVQSNAGFDNSTKKGTASKMKPNVFSSQSPAQAKQ
jgi:adhesin transport system outer membrane protein